MMKPKKKSPREKPFGGPEVSKNSFGIEFDRKVIKSLASWQDEKLDRLNNQLLELAKSFGFPHRHAGLGIRGLGRGHYEFRWDLDLRFVFTRRDRVLVIHLVGNHNAVRQFLRAHR